MDFNLRHWGEKALSLADEQPSLTHREPESEQVRDLTFLSPAVRKYGMNVSQTLINKICLSLSKMKFICAMGFHFPSSLIAKKREKPLKKIFSEGITHDLYI